MTDDDVSNDISGIHGSFGAVLKMSTVENDEEAGIRISVT